MISRRKALGKAMRVYISRVIAAIFVLCIGASAQTRDHVGSDFVFGGSHGLGYKGASMGAGANFAKPFQRVVLFGALDMVKAAKLDAGDGHRVTADFGVRVPLGRFFVSGGGEAGRLMTRNYGKTFARLVAGGGYDYKGRLMLFADYLSRDGTENRTTGVRLGFEAYHRASRCLALKFGASLRAVRFISPFAGVFAPVWGQDFETKIGVAKVKCE
jgi:hypothetical protein